MLGNHKFKHNLAESIIELENQMIYEKYSGFSKHEISTLFFECFRNKDILKLIIAINKHKNIQKSIILNVEGMILIENNQIYYKTENSINTDLNCSFDESLGIKTFYDYDLVEVLKKEYNIFSSCNDFLSLICELANELGLYSVEAIGNFSDEKILESFELLSLIENNIEHLL